MIISTLENSALVLGLLIAINTIFSAVQNYVVADRRRHALLGAVDQQIKAFTRLASVMGDRAGRIRKRIKPESDLGGLTLPDQIDDKSRKDIDRILARVDHILEVRREWDVETIAPFLSARQRTAFLALMDAHDLYCDRLDIRTREFREAPKAHGALGRLIACTHVDLEPSLRDAAQKFAATLGSRAASAS